MVFVDKGQLAEAILERCKAVSFASSAELGNLLFDATLLMIMKSGT